MKQLNPEELTELKTIADERGLLTPEALLERATDPSSALHPRFTWDDHAAARLRRLDEARDIITRVRVRMQFRPTEPPRKVRAFVSLASDRVIGGGYRPLETVLSDKAMREELLRTAIAELRVMQRRYRHLSELASVFEQLDHVAAHQVGA